MSNIINIHNSVCSYEKQLNKSTVLTKKVFK